MARLRAVVGTVVLGALLAILAAPVFAHGGAGDSPVNSFQDPISREVRNAL